MIKLNTLITVARLLLLLPLLGQNATVAVHIQRINPYEKVLKILLKEPPVGVDNKTTQLRDYVAEKWLPQKLDHFAAGSRSQTWMMRYYANADFYQPGGPIFIMVGGEWEIHPYILHEGHFYDMAKQHGALMFYTEHRYYGHSWPNSGNSLHDFNYLSVLQSLEDLRHFIEYQKSTSSYLQEAKVVLVGGSYSGSMVTWFMKLYPDVADVAWASSAPLVAKMDFYEYMTYAMQSLKDKGGATCAQNVEEGFRGLHRMLTSSESAELLRRLQTCSRFDETNEMDLAALFNGLGNYFAAVVQSRGSVITQFCRSFLAMDSDPTEALVKYVRAVFLPYAEEQEERADDEEYCLDLSYEGLKSIFSDNGDIYAGTRCWFYQTCHEFGWFATTMAPNASSQVRASSPFAGQVSLKFFQSLCQDVFYRQDDAAAAAAAGGSGVVDYPTLHELHSRAETINHIFGGLTNVSQRVIFTHGLLDPWRAVGMQRGQNVLLLRDYSHVEDLGSINLSDTVEMNVAKLKVAAFINKALRD